MCALPGKSYGGHTLREGVDQIEQLTGRRSAQAFADQGIKGHDETCTEALISRQSAASQHQSNACSSIVARLSR